ADISAQIDKRAGHVIVGLVVAVVGAFAATGAWACEYGCSASAGDTYRLRSSASCIEAGRELAGRQQTEIQFAAEIVGEVIAHAHRTGERAVFGGEARWGLGKIIGLVEGVTDVAAQIPARP